MITLILIILSISFSSLVRADGGCQSAANPACFLWSSVLTLGISSFFWIIFSPIFIILNSIIELEKRYNLLCLFVSFIAVILTIGLSMDGVYDFIWQYRELEHYKNLIIWLITPIMFFLI